MMVPCNGLVGWGNRHETRKMTSPMFNTLSVKYIGMLRAGGYRGLVLRSEV